MIDVKYTIISYTHSGYCSGNTNLIVVNLDFNTCSLLSDYIFAEPFESLIKFLCEHFDIPSPDHSHIFDIESMDELDNNITIKCVVNDSGSNYCDVEDNKYEFIQSKYYDLIQAMQVGDMYIIIHT